MTDEPNNGQSGGPLLPQRSMLDLHKIPDITSGQPEQPTQEAAAKVIRSQIDSLYSSQTQNTPSSTETVNPYHRVHTEHSNPSADQWKNYHSAWQNYYQKYYEGYYTHHLKNAQQTLKEQTTGSHPNNPSYFTGISQPEPTQTPTTNEIMYDLRQRLINRVRTSATKVRKSRHFIPIIAGLAVILLFLFLQYNRVLVSNVVAYVSPGNIDPQNIVIDPNGSVVVSPNPRLIIPKINVDVPVIYDVGNDYDSQMAAMVNGVAHFAIPGASSHPGQIGNTVIAGHSSNDLLDSGDYKFIFAQLDKLNVGDTIYANYNSIRYTYTVTGKEVVNPNDTGKLVYPTSKPILTLLTCTPLGTSKYRLLVTAEQVSPDPNQSTTAPVTTSEQTKSIPGNSLTLFERIFGGGN